MTNQIISAKPANQDAKWPTEFESAGPICGVDLHFKHRVAGGYDLYDKATNTYQGWCIDNSKGNGFKCFNIAYFITFDERFVCFTPICN